MPSRKSKKPILPCCRRPPALSLPKGAARRDGASLPSRVAGRRSQVTAQSGMLPCFLGGLVSRLFLAGRGFSRDINSEIRFSFLAAAGRCLP